MFPYSKLCSMARPLQPLAYLVRSGAALTGVFRQLEFPRQVPSKGSIYTCQWVHLPNQVALFKLACMESSLKKV